MPVNKDPSTGRRSVQAEVEVPGTPEQVWDAIATGPGITSWFVPTDLEERLGGVTVSHFGPGMDSEPATITEWHPPHRFVAKGADDGGIDVATEWIVEARSGGSCVVRVVHSWFAEGDDWDGQFEGHSYGWLAFFRVLRAYLEHFAGEHGAPVQVMGVTAPPKEAAWEAWMRALGFGGATVGTRVQAPEGAPPLAGTVEWAGQPAWPEELLLRLDEPAPGIAHLVSHPMGQVYLTLRLYLFGDNASAAASDAQAAWQAWMDATFAPVTPPGDAA